MNRRERRARARQPGRNSATASSIPLQDVDDEDAYAAALAHYRTGAFTPAQDLCRAILERDPLHVRSLVLLGDIAQQGGRNKLAVKLLGRALELDCGDPAAHDTIALAYEGLGRRDEAVRHFTQAIALGLADAERLVKQSAAVAGPLKRLADAFPRQPELGELLGAQGAETLAAEGLLLALLQSKVIHDPDLERLFTMIRSGLVRHAVAGVSPIGQSAALEFFSALAQQCFLNEYVFALDDGERAQLRRVADRIVTAVNAGTAIAPIDLVATASYMALHRLPMASALLSRAWPAPIAPLLAQQVREPLEEEADLANIPPLTDIDDAVSLKVQNQYEENPYPRWTAVPQIKPTTVVHFLRDKLGISPASWPVATVGVHILVAGCGTGSHSIDSALRFPRAQLLAIDISRVSLAYARRKSRALGLANIEYARADILKLASLDRRFDVIEAVGVLHHLSDPTEGWRQLLSLLRPNGLMLVGLYSAAARQPLATAREFIAARGYRATADDIRTCRQELIRRIGFPPFRDFSNISGCRDLLFNVMEHQFTLPQIKLFLEANQLSFLGFGQLPPDVVARFRRQFSDAGMLDLDAWHTYEQANPLTFGNMYIFWVQKRGLGGGTDAPHVSSPR